MRPALNWWHAEWFFLFAESNFLFAKKIFLQKKLKLKEKQKAFQVCHIMWSALNGWPTQHLSQSCGIVLYLLSLKDFVSLQKGEQIAQLSENAADIRLVAWGGIFPLLNVSPVMRKILSCFLFAEIIFPCKMKKKACQVCQTMQPASDSWHATTLLPN